MVERYLDIIPPGIETEQDSQTQVETFNASKKIRGRTIFLLLLALGLVLLLGAHFTFQKAVVKIWPSKIEVSDETEVQVQENAVLNFASLLLPAQELKISQKLSQSFPASFVTQERKAEGIIKVYNFYSSTPLNFVAQTRFLSADGKLFRAPNKITIPGKRTKGRDTEPGVAEVRVVAAEPGESYNIGPTRFSLPGLVGTPAYTLVYGESSEPMRGGFSGQGRMILQEDLDNANNVLTSKLKQENFKALEQKFGATFVFIEDTLSHQIINSTSSSLVGEQKESFDYTVELETKILGIKREVVQALSKELLQKKSPQGYELRLETLNFSLGEKSFNPKEKKGIFLLRSSGKFYAKEDLLALKGSLAGLKKSQALFLLKNKFERSEVILSPFWLKRLPKDPTKINIELVLD